MLSMVAIPADSLLYFSCSTVRKPGGVRVLRSANREKILSMVKDATMRNLQEKMAHIEHLVFYCCMPASVITLFFHILPMIVADFVVTILSS